MGRGRLALSLAGLAVAAAVAAYAVTGPAGYLAPDRLRHPLLLATLFWAPVAVAGAAARPRLPRWAWAVAGPALVSFAGAAVLSVLAPPREVRQRVVSPDGRYEARLVETSDVGGLDLAWEVWVRERRGLLSRERCVVRGVESYAITAVRFTGPRQLAVTAADATHRLAFDAALRPSALLYQSAYCADPLGPVAGPGE